MTILRSRRWWAGAALAAALAWTVLGAPSGCTGGDVSGLPTVGMIQCTPTAIPCGDTGRTVVLCTAKGFNLADGNATFTWKCSHSGSGVPTCDYARPAASPESCSPFPDAVQCVAAVSGSSADSSIELRCSGKVREICMLTVAQGERVSDPRKVESRFEVSISPPCAAPDAAMAADGGADGG